MSSKVDRAKYGPSWTEVIVGVALSVLIGLLAGFAVLAFRPVQTVKEIPKDGPVGQIYFIEGTHVPVRGSDVERKEKELVQGQTVLFDENELNFAFAPATPKKPVDPKAKNAPPAALLAAAAPNFRIHDGALQVSSLVTVSVYGWSQDIIVQTNGGFEKEDGVYTYEPTSILIGSCQIAHLPFLPKYLKKKVATELNFPPDLAAAWSKLTEVGIQGTSLKLVH